MDGSGIASIFIRWVHILAAVTAAGGTMFFWLVVRPRKDSPEDTSPPVVSSPVLLRRWRMTLRGCFIVLLASGVYNFVVHSLPRIDANGATAYHPVFGIKMLAVMGLFGMWEVILGKIAKSPETTSDLGRFRTALGILAVSILLLSAILRSF